MKFEEKLMMLRKSRGMSQEDLAEKLQVSSQTISLWETNQAAPTLENLLLLKNLFGVPIDEILGADQAEAPAINKDSLDTICAALAYALGIEPSLTRFDKFSMRTLQPSERKTYQIKFGFK